MVIVTFRVALIAYEQQSTVRVRMLRCHVGGRKQEALGGPGSLINALSRIPRP